ncbi:protein L17 [Seminavis robusta]|uniref:Protein L17 n=1 Tax=Seminavis robusta TaxID=568900 RepID=A0A9N8EXK3_9STRA|nr:protein L17 [Seminavis robusta]|eukprot:Sro2277_g321720.1 protein L17 (203) ;mRNA; r:7530-8138
MKKRIRFRKLGRTPAHKWAMLRNMVTSLIEHERIVTTLPKAKEVQTVAEKMITLVKRNSPDLQETPSNVLPNKETLWWNGKKIFKTHFNAYRAVQPVIRTPQMIFKCVEVLGPRYQFRDGGYTRVLKLTKRRQGDNAPMALIEYVDRPGEVRAARPPAIFQENAEFWMDAMEGEEVEEPDDIVIGAEEAAELTKDAKMDISK